MGASESSCRSGVEERKDGIMSSATFPEDESSALSKQSGSASASPSRTSSRHAPSSREDASEHSGSAGTGNGNGNYHPPGRLHRKKKHEHQPEHEKPVHENSLEPKPLHKEEQQEPQPPSPHRGGHRSILKSMRRAPANAVHKTSHVVSHVFSAIENFLFQPSRITHLHHAPAPRVRGGVLLQGCESAEEHYALIQGVLLKQKGMHGEDGLAAAGMEYRLVPCDEHDTTVDESQLEVVDSGHGESDSDDGHVGLLLQGLGTGTMSPVSSQPDLVDTTHTGSSLRSSTESLFEVSVHTPSPTTCSDSPFCHLCMHRLFHTASNTMINEGNRKKFIADGDMYEAIARLCQEYAHKAMCDEGNLEWVTISKDETGQGKEPIRALVNCNHPLIQITSDSQRGGEALTGRPTLLIATGKGKVRAGIFSRQHLMCTGLESATALPIVREAVMRQLNVVIVDPNVHGDALGMVTFEKTMAGLFGQWESSDEDDDNDEDKETLEDYAQVTPLQSRDLYILSHSASGSQLARYLLDKSPYYLPHIRAIAFTDSTHNIQWCKTAENDDLYHKLQSPECVYFRCASVRRDGNQWYLHSAGEPIKTDTFWQRRFGKIQTYWAGTDEHSLTNWYSHAKIWEHFDQYLGRIEEVSEASERGEAESKHQT
jgi:hypothetical protein